MVLEKLVEAFNFLRDNFSLKYILTIIPDINNCMRNLINIAIAGATGYVGLELIKILSKHPKVRIVYLCATKSINKNINSFDAQIKSKKLPKISNIKKINWQRIDILFAALPDGEAQKIILKAPKKIKLIDLSADFRLSSVQLYKKWYGLQHKAKNLIKDSIYSITEFSREKLPNFRIIACPGCYPTSIQLPLIPLLKEKLIKIKNITIDSKSGYSGAGKKFKKNFKYKNLFNSFSAYKIGIHKHLGEIDQELSKTAGRKINVTFTPHLIPVFRGILSTIYIETNNNITAENIYKFLKKYHKKNHFVKIAKFNSSINTGDVMNTNYCKISICKNREKNRVIILSAIDNLIKGASGQAVQNMNSAFKINEKTGLI